MKVSILVMALAVMLCLASFAAADNPPSWRGDPGTTYQSWDFVTDGLVVSAESGSNPYGTPVATVAPDSLATGYWGSWPEIYGSAVGIWDIGGGSITLSIPNTPNSAPNTRKDVQVWVEYWLSPSAAPGVSIPGADPLSGEAALVEPGPPGPGAWFANSWLFQITPNPTSETIIIQGDPAWGTQINQIVVDTRCYTVPEPSSLVAFMTMSAGLMGLFLKRRRA